MRKGKDTAFTALDLLLDRCRQTQSNWSINECSVVRGKAGAMDFLPVYNDRDHTIKISVPEYTTFLRINGLIMFISTIDAHWSRDGIVDANQRKLIRAVVIDLQAAANRYPELTEVCNSFRDRSFPA